MSHVPFVDQLGDSLESAAARHLATDGAPRGAWWRRISPSRRRTRVIAVLAVLALAGGGALAATQQSSVTLVAGGLACYAGTGADSSAYFDVEPNGRSPLAACAAVFRKDGPAALAAPGVKLLACTDPHGYIAVFEAAKDADDQCRRLGMSQFQAAPYAAAQSTVDGLVAALGRLHPSAGCVPVRTLRSEVQAVLVRLGWSGWHAEQQRTPSPGRCGLFEGTGASFSDPTASIDAGRRVVWVVAGPLPRLLRLAGPLDLRLLRASGRRCYDPAGARALVERSLARANVALAFALTREPRGGGWAFAQGNYNRGCTIVSAIWPATVGARIDVWLNAKSGAAVPPNGNPAPGDFRTISEPLPARS